MGRIPKPAIERFMSKVQKHESGCWIWTASLSQGYGQFRQFSYKPMVASHRFSYSYFVGEIPPNMFVCHRCDNPLCVNPEHLFLGTPYENTHDMDLKGRRISKPVRGEFHPRVKLTKEDVIEIRLSNDDQRKLAERYGVRPAAISKIKTGRNWKHI